MNIALDLDGTLAHYDGWKGVDHIGDPVPAMMKKVRDWIDEGHNIEIFTARVSGSADDAALAAHYICKWLREHDLPPFEIGCIKKKKFELFIDDRAIMVLKNRGIFQ